MILSSILIVIGFVLLIVGADLLVDGASGIAKNFHIPEIIIGLTIVSIGTSMPELFVSITSALDGYSDMAIGNIVGSNLSNLLLILGLSATIKPVFFQKETRIYEIPMCLFVTGLLMYFCNTGTGISRQEGIMGLKVGGDLTVNNAVDIANYFNLSEKLISLTILAVGTSLPELVTSVTAAIKGNSDIAIGNIIGSNIFNILLIIGTSAFITPITYNITYNFDFTVLLVSSIILALFPFIPPKNEMSRMNGIVYLLIYAGYMAILFIK